MCLSYFKVMKPKLKNMVSWDYANLKACDTERCFVGDTENAVQKVYLTLSGNWILPVLLT